MPKQIGSQALADYMRAKRVDAGLSQADLARLAGLQASYVSSIEHATIKVVYPDQFNKLRNVLRFPGWECLEKMGYNTDAATGTVSPALAALISSMTEAQQSLMTKQARLYLTNWDTLGSENGATG